MSHFCTSVVHWRYVLSKGRQAEEGQEEATSVTRISAATPPSQFWLGAGHWASGGGGGLYVPDGEALGLPAASAVRPLWQTILPARGRVLGGRFRAILPPAAGLQGDHHSGRRLLPGMALPFVPHYLAASTWFGTA